MENLRVATGCPDLTGRTTTSTPASTKADMSRCTATVQQSAISHQDGDGETANRELQSDSFNSTRRRCTRSQSHGRNSTRRRCTRYTPIAHAQHTIAWHFDGTYEYGSDDTTNLPKGKPTASSEGSLAVRRGGGAGEYLNGKNLHSLSLYLNG